MLVTKISVLQYTCGPTLVEQGVLGLKSTTSKNVWKVRVMPVHYDVWASVG